MIAIVDDESRGGSIRIWFRIAGAVFVFAALAAFFTGFFRSKFYGLTGKAEWLWVEHRLSSGDPVVFFAVREFVVPPSPPFVRVKIAADPEYTVYLNGRRLGGGVSGDRVTLDVYDVTELANKGATNRLLIAMRSAKGVGGLLASVDFAPLRENDVVSDDSWKIFREWSDELPVRDPAGAIASAPFMIGTPPVGRWNYVSSRPHPIDSADPAVQHPVASYPVEVTVRRIEIISGVAVASAIRERGTAFDFGPVSGRAEFDVALATQFKGARVIRVRYANDPSELTAETDVRSIVVAPGEHRVSDPEIRAFRYVAVLDQNTKVFVVRQPLPILPVKGGDD